MQPWIVITVLAAFMQNLRSALQRNLLGRLAPTGATYVRFLYAVPFSVLYYAYLARAGAANTLTPSGRFVAFAIFGGVLQIVATLLLIRTFVVRSFAVGTVYSKTETVQAAIFGLVVLGETVSFYAIAGIVVSGIGVLLLGGAPSTGASSAGAESRRAVWLGIASGGAFALSVVCYRGASLSLGGNDYVLQSAFTLAAVTVFQALAMGAYLLVRERQQLVLVLREWRGAIAIGASGMVASAAWFAALTLERAAYVRAVGQVELLFTFAASILYFGEKVRPRDAAGALCVIGGIWLLLARG